jgi:hypothetical protein
LLSAALKSIMVSDGAVIISILFLTIGLLPIFVREFRSSARLQLAYWFVIALHQAVAFTNTFLFVTLGATSDASHFHSEGVALAHSEGFFLSIGARLYENMLGVVYWLLVPSQLLGAQLSILAFAVSCIVLIKLLGLLELSRYKVSVLMVFGALPSMIFFGSVTLRESIEVLFFMLAIYWGIKMHFKSGVNAYFIFMTVSTLVMGVLHSALIIYSAFLLVLLVVWVPHPASGWMRIKKRHLMLVLAILALLTGIIISTKVQLADLGRLSELVDMNLLESSSSFRSNATKSRTTYDIVLDLSSPFAAIYTSLVVYTHYLFAPFPWQIKNGLDLYASMESILRMILIYFSVKHWRSAYGVQRRLLMLMLILFFSMSFMWGMGTTNYGTSIRHHMMSWWILAIAGIPSLMKMLSRFLLGSRVHRHSHSLSIDRETS